MRLCDNQSAAPPWGRPPYPALLPPHCQKVPHRAPAMPYIVHAQADGSAVIHAHRFASS